VKGSRANDPPLYSSLVRVTSPRSKKQNRRTTKRGGWIRLPHYTCPAFSFGTTNIVWEIKCSEHKLIRHLYEELCLFYVNSRILQTYQNLWLPRNNVYRCSAKYISGHSSKLKTFKCKSIAYSQRSVVCIHPHQTLCINVIELHVFVTLPPSPPQGFILEQSSWEVSSRSLSQEI
jgi:hypothetical protein